MPLLINVLLTASLLLSIALALRTGKNIKATGMSALFSIVVFFAVWVVGELIELNTTDFQWMLWGRNLQQIGVFFTPLSTLYFSIAYTSNHGLKKIVYLITVIQIVSVLLIFTDQYHHIMRDSVAIQPDAILGQAFVVHSSKIGSALVAFNFCIPIISVSNLIAFYHKVSARRKRPLWLIIISIIATFVLALIQATVLCGSGINIPIPVWNLPCLILFAYAVLTEGIVGVTPTALSKVFEVIDQGIIVVDDIGKVLEFNRRASELMGNMILNCCLKAGVNITAYLSATNADRVKSFSVDSLPVELKNSRRNQYVALAYHALEAREGKLIGYVIVLTDITALKVRAEIDSLTGTNNREGLVNAFTDLQNESEHLPYFSALIVDLDDFKQINDTYGHLCGDVILCDFVGTAQSLLAEKRFLGRLGGDEFVVILPTERNEAVALAEKLRQSVATRAVQYLDFTVHYTVSIGIAFCKSDHCQLSELLHLADLALYEAKRSGKNTVHNDCTDAYAIL